MPGKLLDIKEYVREEITYSKSYITWIHRF